MKKFLAVLALVLVASPAFAVISGTKHDLSNTTGEICVYCHTPHGATVSAGAPLWNRKTAMPGGVVSYTGYSMQGASGSSYTTTDVPLCMSCHDGVTLMSALNNSPNVGLGNGATVAITGGSNALLGTDLSNDHPVGFAVVADTEISTAVGTLIQCSSCHDVHDNTNNPFLAWNNANSAGCLGCHIK